MKAPAYRLVEGTHRTLGEPGHPVFDVRVWRIEGPDGLVLRGDRPLTFYSRKAAVDETTRLNERKVAK